MFRDREERRVTQLTQEIAPYRGMATDLEAEDRLLSSESELTIAGRHLLTSNDRYQMTAAHLTLARNRTVLTNAIADVYTTPSGPDFRGENFSHGTISTFLVSNYRDIKTGVETADIVSGTTGFTSTDEYIDQFNRLNSSLQWPAPDSISRHFVVAGVSAVDTVMAYTMHHYDAVFASSNVPNDFKFHLKRRLQPLIGEVDAKRRAIDRATNMAVGSINNTVILEEVYEDVRDAIRVLDEISVWITMPRLYEPLFTLRDPLDELRPERREFDPTNLGTAATETVVRRPLPSGKPFNADALNQAAVQAPPAVEPRPFDTGALNPPHQPPAVAKPSRPFDPGALSQKPQESRPFDPGNITGKAPEKRDNRPFDPGALNRSETEEN